MKKKEFIKELESREIDFEEVNDEIVITKKNGGYVDLYSLTSMPKGVKFENGGDVLLPSLTSMPEVKFENRRLCCLVLLQCQKVKFENRGYVYLNSLTSMPEGV